MRIATDIVKDGLGPIPLYTVLGNHDTYPQNLFATQYARQNPSLNDWTPAWDPFLLTDEQRRTFYNFGYYSAPLVDSEGNTIGDKFTKVISFNANYCYQFNFKQFTQFWDPGNILDWLDNELAELERIGGQAIMLSHVPNIEECTRQFGQRWHALMDRYQTVIRFGLYGHWHYEFYNI